MQQDIARKKIKRRQEGPGAYPAQPRPPGEVGKAGKIRTAGKAGSVGEMRTAGKVGSAGKTGTGMDYGVYTLTLREWFFYAAQGLAGCALAAYVFYRSAAAFLVMAPVGIVYPLYCREDLKRQRLCRLNLEFKDGILVLASFLSAGYSIENAVAASGRELTLLYGADGLMAGEFEEMARGLRLNRTVESVFLDLGGRSGLEDVNNFAQVFAAAKRSGGDLVEIISHTAGVIRDKVQVQEEIHTMTASKAFEQKIMSLVPVLIVLYIDLTSPGFFDIMYRTMAGRLVMSGCLAVYGISLLLARRILQVEI